MLLQHGLLESSAVFVDNGPGRSLAFALADAGFDVWMSNTWVPLDRQRCVSAAFQKLVWFNTTYACSACLHSQVSHCSGSGMHEL